MNFKAFLLFIFFTLPVFSQEQKVNIQGYVFLDRNGNGQFDKNERGLRKVFLSDGKQIFETNRKGKFRAQIERGRSLFVIIPNGYKSQRDAWYINIPTGENNKNSKKINFALEKHKALKKYNFLAIGDVQVDSDEELKMAGNTILEEISNINDYEFSLYLGDLVNDDPKLLNPIKELFNQTDKPYKTIYGNHDRHIDGTPFQSSSYRDNFGPPTYAFFKNNTLFIALNSIFPVGKYGYEGRYKERHLDFVKNVIQLADKHQLIIISQHIPLKWMKNKKELLELLDIENEVLFITAHTHSVIRYFYPRKSGLTDIQELVAGTTSGNWWTGQRNYKGIPLALMKDGSPRGYFKIKVNKNQYEFEFKGVQKEENDQFNYWAGELEANKVPVTIDKENSELLINFFAGSDKSEIKLYVNDTLIGDMKQRKLQDPFVKKIKRLQKEKLYPNALSRRAPYLSTPTDHIWSKELPYEKMNDLNKIRVVIKDPFLPEYSKTFYIWKK